MLIELLIGLVHQNISIIYQVCMTNQQICDRLLQFNFEQNPLFITALFI